MKFLEKIDVVLWKQNLLTVLRQTYYYLAISSKAKGKGERERL